MLIDYYPEAVGKIREMKEICNAEQPEIDNINKEIDRLLANRFISKADEHGIARFEKELGIIPVAGQSLEDRRITAMIKAGRKNLSFKDVVNLIRNFSERIDLIPDYDKSELNVVAEGIGDVQDIYDTLDEMIALNVLIYFSAVKSEYMRVGAVWQDDEVFLLKEAGI